MSQGNIAVTDQAGAVDPEKIEACTVLEVISRISGKWAIGILLQAMRGPVRFTALERSVEGISRRMLTLTLRNLERDGLLVRTVYPTIPPRVEYEATPRARELYETLSGLVGWAERHREAIAVSRVAYDGNTAC
ncbi:winged helix-turn-helix transcriptional regulator [Amycolatopsis jiangsuensis]|uniref:DNA-binding HxlR family transcriptional regulator n=1 Tax=Amycolatopsis jiangsuensis TaxID=1181879 RepID=A0A840INE1_9PSEU|nr:helix-turn-helix domain-containing protein [Amycolatopsis jiangsuensis]MBB4682975.1 DNA-binding HxlR family transcriptional regulator [Amycolatopsis jiangsuensis]